VVLTGSESTGKTVLAGQLAARFGATLVPEYAREYARRVGRPLTFDDHAPIAHGQMAAEEKHAASGGDSTLLIQDTDLLSTLVYCHHYYDQHPSWLASAARERRPDLYLLLETDAPWVPDGVRDMGHRREEVQQLFREAVSASGAPYVTVSGSWPERFEIAVNAIQSLLDRASWNPPVRRQPPPTRDAPRSPSRDPRTA